MSTHQKILILDFGSQVTQLIARRVRDAHVFCEVHPCDVTDEWIRDYAADGKLKGILGYTDEKLVSSDFNHDPHSSVFHMDQTKVMDGTFVSILSWYDNEWGFSNRMADTAVAMGKLI